MKNSINQKEFSEKIHRFLLQEVEDKNSQLNKLIDNAALNIILKTLSERKRIEFYQLLSMDDYKSAQNFIRSEIPNFNKLIQKEVKVKFERMK